MKKRALTFVFLLLGTLAFVSCQKDNAEDGTFVRPDELAYLQGHFAAYDDEGVLQCWAGWQLNEADPGELSMMADSYEAAAAIFKKIILPEAKVEEGENSLVWHLTGEDGRSQGDAVLSKASGDKVAVLTLPAAATLVNRVNFIPHSLWPENGEQEFREELDDFYLYNLVQIEVNTTKSPGSIYCAGNHGTGTFLVLEEYDQETNTWGYLLRLPDKERQIYEAMADAKFAPIKSTFDEVRKIYLDHQVIFDKVMEKAGFAPSSKRFLVKINDKGDTGLYQLDNGASHFGKPHYECLVYRFGFVRRSDTTYSSYLTVQ